MTTSWIFKSYYQDAIKARRQRKEDAGVPCYFSAGEQFTKYQVGHDQRVSTGVRKWNLDVSSGKLLNLRIFNKQGNHLEFLPLTGEWLLISSNGGKMEAIYNDSRRGMKSFQASLQFSGPPLSCALDLNGLWTLSILSAPCHDHDSKYLASEGNHDFFRSRVDPEGY